MEKEVKGVWRTVRGRRVFIREGEDLKTAMINSGKFKEMRKNYFETDEKLYNKKRENEKAINKIDREIDKKDFFGGSLDEDYDTLVNERHRLMAENADLQKQRELHERKHYENSKHIREGLSITNEQYENLKRNSNVNNLAEKTMKENADKAMTYMGKTPEQIKEVIDEWKAKKNADKFDKARYEEHKQFVDSQIEAWEKTYKEATSDDNYKARLKEMNDRDIVYKEKYTSVMDRYNNDKEFRDRLKAEADKEKNRYKEEMKEFASKYEKMEANEKEEAFEYFKNEYAKDFDEVFSNLKQELKDAPKGVSNSINEQNIERDIKSLFIYKDEANMGSLDKEPLKRYYDKYGKENVDRVWKKMDEKYEVIKGTNMDSEGLGYNSIIEKSKYSAEARQFYQNKMKDIRDKYGYGDSRTYNTQANLAKEEFENYDKNVISSKGLNNYKGKSSEDINYEATKQDILDHYTEDYGWTGTTPEEAFIQQMDAVNYGNATPYQMGKRLAEGGNYLVYNGNMQAYLAKRGMKVEYDDAFSTYTDYMGKQSERLYNEIKSKKVGQQTSSEQNIKAKVERFKEQKGNSELTNSRSFKQEIPESVVKRLNQKGLKELANNGAVDITRYSDEAMKELEKKHGRLEVVKTTKGTYGMNGGLFRSRKTGEYFVVTSRNGNLFYLA